MSSEGPPTYSGDTSTSKLNTSSTLWIQKNKHKLANLPEPGDKWRFYETDLSYHLAKPLYKNDVAERVDREVRPEGHGGGYSYAYKTNPEAYERLQTYLEHTNPVTPCGHESFRNNPDGAMECLTCGSEFAREEMVL